MCLLVPVLLCSYLASHASQISHLTYISPFTSHMMAHFCLRAACFAWLPDVSCVCLSCAAFSFRTCRSFGTK